VRFTSLGRRQLKGLADELELFDVHSDDWPRTERARDPVCGMEMIPTDVAARLVVSGRELSFCCEKCLRVYLEAPLRYRT
jgi:YHS domain-containing protein